LCPGDTMPPPRIPDASRMISYASITHHALGEVLRPEAFLDVAVNVAEVSDVNLPPARPKGSI